MTADRASRRVLTAASSTGPAMKTANINISFGIVWARQRGTISSIDTTALVADANVICQKRRLFSMTRIWRRDPNLLKYATVRAT